MRQKRLVPGLAPKGRPSQRHRQASRLVVDDFGDAVAVEHRCPDCMRWRMRAKGTCNDCKVWRDHARRRAMTPEESEAFRAMRREQRRRRLARYPDAQRQEYERNERAKRERFARDAERQRALKAARDRRYFQRLQQDRERHRRHLENDRIAYRLRQERAGKPVGSGRRVELPSEGSGPELPVAPLVPLVAAFLDANAEQTTENHEPNETPILAQLGMNTRTWWSWKHGRAAVSRCKTLDRVLVGLRLHAWEVWEPSDDPQLQRAHEQAATYWGFEPMRVDAMAV